MKIAEKIDKIIRDQAIVLFMKGTEKLPQCGFSSRVVHVLNKLNADFMAVNVLEDPEMREGIKQYSNWPTIPQLYIRGEFIGGCDIVTELYESGELAAKLKP